MSEKPVFDPEVIRAAVRREPSTSPIVHVIAADDRPLSETTMEIALHADGTFTVLREDIHFEPPRPIPDHVWAHRDWLRDQRKAKP